MDSLRERVDGPQSVVERTVYLDASVPQVWSSLIDENKFGAWFCVRLDAPFRVGEVTYGHGTYPGCEHFRWRAVTETLDHERLLAFTWWPAPVDIPFDEFRATGTLVELSIRATVDGTRVVFRESGFEKLNDDKKLDELMHVREQGWRLQAQNLRSYFESVQA